MEKPLTLQIEELRGNILDQINNSGLHIAVIKPTIEEIAHMVSMEYQGTYNIEKQQYEQSREKSKEEDQTE